jgi:hypothetical protein
MAIAYSHDFVMHAVLGWSATHLSRMTGDKQVIHAAYHHRVQAFEGLRKAINEFSGDNSDAVLGASILLGWQATDP